MTSFRGDGWAWPLNAKKAHYFPDDDVVSLCARWMHSGRREDANHESPDNCAACKRRLAKLKGTT